ncbi:MAG TPA: metallophosphoesterase [Polyangiaceae bacterium]|jgi:3',5'-cyclic AMP phosphodiesterase CpdA|nr:metallophosphoesterase [Polyangiaceae bacterium]
MDSTFNAGARRIAHLSDVHMLDARPSRARSGYSMRHRFLSLGRPLDAVGRRNKLVHALSAARRVGADHVVVSGDLTEVGSPGEFESLGEALHDSGIAAERITLVPGNHDLYTSPDAWARALEGPLSAFEPTSARVPGRLIECAGVRMLPLDVARFQPLTRSAGWIEDDVLDVVARRAADPGLADRPLLVVQHHPPFVRATPAWQWVDGLVGAARLMTILEAFRHLFVLHGHLHAAVDRVLGCGVARVLGATAIVDDKEGPRVRLYDVRGGRIQAAGLVAG